MLLLSPTPAAPAPAHEPAVRGCGWYESSHDLLSGLDVVEHTQPDALWPLVLCGADLPPGASLSWG